MTFFLLNVTRRDIRWLLLSDGYMSINGADTAMFFYTIIESCKLIKLNPRKYLSDMARRHWNGKNLITPFEYAKELNEEI